MKSYRKPLMMLVLITPFLTELLTCSIPSHSFFLPHVFLALMVIYGLAVVVLRELAIRWQLGVVGIFVLGLAYGIYNEGICAKTLLMTENVPIDTFDGYGGLFGINHAWGVLILVWHALHSVVYPILIVHFLFPHFREEKWLNQKWLILSTLVVVGAGSVFFFTTTRYQAPVIYLPIFWILVVVVVLLSKLLPKSQAFQPSIQDINYKPMFLGLSSAVYMLGLILASGFKLPTLLHYCYALTVLFVFYKILCFKQWFSLQTLVLFALGDYEASALLLVWLGLGAKKGTTEILVTGIIFVFVFIIAIMRVRKMKIML